MTPEEITYSLENGTCSGRELLNAVKLNLLCTIFDPTAFLESIPLLEGILETSLDEEVKKDTKDLLARVLDFHTSKQKS